MKTKIALKVTTALVAFTALVLLPSTSSAQGTVFSYQGVLTDNGSPATGIYDLEFRVFDNLIGGTQQGDPLTIEDVAITNGVFTLLLNFGGGIFDGGNRWLDVAVRPGISTGAFTNLAFRQRIASVPYAIRAATFSGPVAASQVFGVLSSNNIGVGTITAPMLALGAVGSNQLAAGAVTTSNLADGAVHLAKLNTVSNWSLPTFFKKPNASGGERLGQSLVAVGNDRVLIGADADNTGALQAGAAYLFSTNGTWLRTFNNPTPAMGERFGFAVAAIGHDRLLIGVPQDNIGAVGSGAVYHFNTNGALLTTFANPSPAVNDQFGRSVAAVGNDRVLIGAPYDDLGAIDAGAAYLFRTNGTLLATFTKPAPVNSEDWFGSSVAALGSDRILIGSPLHDTGVLNVGAVYLFTTNGVLLTTFTTNSARQLGASVAAVGSDRVLIGAPASGAGGTSVGEAFLFHTNGALLTRFDNPNPANYAAFGASVAAVGSDRVLIGTPIANSAAGTAYLFSTNGTLLATFAKPTPGDSENFGTAVAAVGNDQVMIGAPSDDVGGAAYLFSMNAVSVRGLFSEGLLDAGTILSGTLTDGRLSSNVALRAGGNSFTGDQILSSGNLGIGTLTPLATLDVNGSFRVGSGTTIFRNLQGGSAQLPSGTSTGSTNFTFTFPQPFTSVPIVIVSARNTPTNPNWPDTFAVTVRAVTTTQCSVNIVRADSAAGWGQLLHVNWLAWE